MDANPANPDGETGFSDKPIPTAVPRVGAGENAPQGEELFDYVLDCLNNGNGKADVRKLLITFGYSATDADEIVENVAEWRRSNPSSIPIRIPDPPKFAPSVGDGGRNMLIGGGICLLGILITVGTCMAATERGGGTYTIAYGAIIWGAIQFFRGVLQSSHRDQT